MRSLQQARQQARACRDMLNLNATPDIDRATDAIAASLMERVSQYLCDTHGIELHRATAAFLDGGRAEVSPAEGCLFYDEQLEQQPVDKLLVVLHELGHLELHPRLQRCCAAPDPVYGTMYLNDGAPALARYNRRSREEAEANAFATEFLCPSHDLLQQWRHHPHERLTDLAQRFAAPVSIIRAQLAEALYWLAMGQPSDAQPTHRIASDCDPSQLQAATYTGGPALVDAGPGTGKTTTLIRRIAYLLEDCGAEPDHLLVLTFSNDAADELRDRIAAQCGAAQAAQINVSTFHGFGVAFLHHHGQFLDLSHDVSLLDEAAQAELITELLGTVPCDPLVTLHNPDISVKAIVRHIAYLKDRLYTPDDLEAAITTWQHASPEAESVAAAAALTRIYRAYETTKQARQRVDFADLIALPIHIFQAQPDLRQAYRAKYRWIMVDEYQDVSRSVADLLRQLCGPENPPWVVGDARQAIYQFRGAAPENVTRFADDFPGAQPFHLATNYRSCTEIVQAANQLATLMVDPADPSSSLPHLGGQGRDSNWACGSTSTALGNPSVSIARADSDQAEHDAIVAQIEAWISHGVPTQDIAVLARRNVDVRDITLKLGQRHIQTTTAGLITPEGNAGDLAAIVTLTDQPRASLPRLAFALGRGRFAPAIINCAIRYEMDWLSSRDHLENPAPLQPTDDDASQLITAVRKARASLQAEHFSGDAFTMMCAFLFEGSDYLRRILDQPAGAAQSLALGEIITALSRAAGYRFLHPDVEPSTSRKGFGQAFRAGLSPGSPSLTPPQRALDAVQVMTCHASKGLEFPCVIVAGQTLTQASQTYTWLPPALAPVATESHQQADSLFFVGVTRAQRALFVTYASSASGTPRSREREMTPLLGRWHDAHAVPIQDSLTSPVAATQTGAQAVSMTAIWGGALPRTIAARALDLRTCSLRTYLEHYLGAQFPQHIPPLYPLFFDVVRRAMGRIVHLAQSQDAPLSNAAAKDIFLREWPSRKVADHPHRSLYANLALRAIEQFASVYIPHPKAETHLDLTVQDATTGLALRYDLLAHYETTDGTTVAITLRPESLQAKHRNKGLLWSGLSSAQRASFVLLKRDYPALQPYVFSAADGALYAYQWTANSKELAAETDRMIQHHLDLTQGQFTTTIREWSCHRCPVRLSCPHWIGALDSNDHNKSNA